MSNRTPGLMLSTGSRAVRNRIRLLYTGGKWTTRDKTWWLNTEPVSRKGQNEPREKER